MTSIKIIRSLKPVQSNQFHPDSGTTYEQNQHQPANTERERTYAHSTTASKRAYESRENGRIKRSANRPSPEVNNPTKLELNNTCNALFTYEMLIWTYTERTCPSVSPFASIPPPKSLQAFSMLRHHVYFFLCDKPLGFSCTAICFCVCVSFWFQPRR